MLEQKNSAGVVIISSFESQAIIGWAGYWGTAYCDCTPMALRVMVWPCL